ncbi:MAG: S46 family peptidase [Thermoanaerobaculia bacterium]|nr:S46 family peptidase [Thermoanaerobaculia bacterium]
MKLRRLLPLTLVLTIAGSVHAGEGMWMPEQVPLFQEQLAALGMTVDAKSFSDLTGFPMGAVISLGGCTASFVSPKGLVVTNHHCAFGAVQYNSTPERDLTVNGFLAKSIDEELPAAPGSKVWVTTKIDDVTEHLRGKIDATITGKKRHDVLEERTKALVAECERPGGVRCRVASYFEGAKYLRITQMEIRDVRLVYAPAEKVGDFGGEIDNFMWPRHTGDFSFYRAYVGRDGKPADFSKDNVPFEPAQFLKVSTGEISDGDLVIVAGYPGRTSRHVTADEYKIAEELYYPRSIEHYRTVASILAAESAKSDAARIRLASRSEANSNGLKRFEGTLAGMKKGNLLARKRTEEAELKAWIAADPARAKRYGGALEEVAKLDARKWATQERDFLAGWLGRSSTLLSQATTISRLAIERGKKDALREPGYQERDWPRIRAASERAQRSLDVDVDKLLLAHFLKLAVSLPEGQRIQTVDKALLATGETTADAQVTALIERLFTNTKLADKTARAAMLEETPAQQRARRDAMLDFGREIEAEQFGYSLAGDEIQGSMAIAKAKYMDAILAMRGGKVYPDANGTLRVTFGTLEGYNPRDGVRYNSQTTIDGVLAKNTGVDPFNSPAALLEAARAGRTAGYVDAELGALPVNFLTNCDTTGGNSGSPTLNRKGELCGLLFDGNYESIASDWVFVPEVARSIHVDSRYMLWVMDYVDGAHNLMREMGFEPKSSPK